MKRFYVLACLLVAACSPSTGTPTASSSSTKPASTAPSAGSSATASSAPASAGTLSFVLDGVPQKIGGVDQLGKQPAAEGAKSIRWGFGTPATAADEWVVNVTLYSDTKAPNDPAFAVADIKIITIIATGVDAASQVNAGGALADLGDKMKVAINGGKLDIHFKADVTNPAKKMNNVAFDATGLRLK